MKQFQIELYNDLMNLCQSTEAFYYVDKPLDECIYRIFSYRLARYSEFCLPNALECRGHMFEIDLNQNPIRLASFPPKKFFNLNENPYTMDMDLSKVKTLSLKQDGSLISTYLHKNQLMLKSKTSLSSDVAIQASNWLNKPENSIFKCQMQWLARQNYTINLEWISPHNRIVIGYLEPKLVVLNVRDHNTGELLNYNDVIGLNYTNEITQRWTQLLQPDITYIQDIPNMSGIEGYVMWFEDGTLVKYKTQEYCALHHTKDSINNPRRLYECVLRQATDDLKSMFMTDELAIKQICEMEEYVDKIYNHLIAKSEQFFDTNKHLSRKDYAILAKEQLDNHGFTLAINKFIGKEMDVAEYMIKKYREFGITDIQLD